MPQTRSTGPARSRTRAAVALHALQARPARSLALEDVTRSAHIHFDVNAHSPEQGSDHVLEMEDRGCEVLKEAALDLDFDRLGREGEHGKKGQR